MPGPIVPSPIVVPGRQQPRIGQMLLQSLIQSAAPAALGLGMEKFFPQAAASPTEALMGTVQGRERLGTERVADEALQQRGAPSAYAPSGSFSSENIRSPQRFDDVNARRAAAPEQFAAIEAQERAAAAQASMDSARARLMEDPQNGPQLVRAFDIATAMQTAGLGADVISQQYRQMMPPTEAEKVQQALDQTNINKAETEAAADEYATQSLVSRGILPEGSPPMPGAAASLLRVVEGQVKEPIDWVQWGMDLVESQVGRAAGSPLLPGPDGQILTAPGLGAEGTVSIEGAIDIARTAITTMAPPEEVERIMGLWQSNMAQKRLTFNLAKQQVARLIGLNPDTSDEDISAILEGAFTAGEIQEIITAAKAAPLAGRSNRPR